MSIEMPAAEVFALAATLTGQAETADEARGRLTGAEGVGPDLLGAATEFLDCHSTGAGALAGELRLLGGTVARVAESWLRMDHGLLAGEWVPRS